MAAPKLTREDQIQALVPRPTIQDILNEERVEVPDWLRSSGYVYLGSDDVPVARYTSRAFHDLEVERVWGRTWQMACLEQDIPNPGDTLVYDVAGYSILVVKQPDGEIKAFHNACLHRGNQLRETGGNVDALFCTFHGFCWNLDGTLKDVPSRWDFPHVEDGNFALPEVQVGVWDGFVFVNPDAAAPPLQEYLGSIVGQAARPPLAERYKAVHIAKKIRCNWKVALEAFLESYHTIATHTQSLPYAGDANAQYDVYDSNDHWNRMIMAMGVPSPHLGPEADDPVTIIEALTRDEMFMGNDKLTNGAGDQTPRQLMAEQTRLAIKTATGYDGSGLTDCEAIDAIQLFLFPNLCPWLGFGVSLIYRFRPIDHDPDLCVMDVLMMLPFAKDAPRPPSAPIHWLGADEDWTAAEEMGNLALIFNQDESNLPKVQRGLHAMKKPGVTLGNYQEIRIRHFHDLLSRYVADDAAP